MRSDVIVGYFLRNRCLVVTTMLFFFIYTVQTFVEVYQA